MRQLQVEQQVIASQVRSIRGQAIVIYYAHLSQWLGKDVDSDSQLPLQSARASHQFREQSLTCLWKANA